MTLDLFAAEAPELEDEILDPGAVVLRGFADAHAAAPFRHLVTPGGFRMSVAMTNCGELGWVSDRRGYRYDPVDPDSGSRWPALPESFRALARDVVLQRRRVRRGEAAQHDRAGRQDLILELGRVGGEQVERQPSTTQAGAWSLAFSLPRCSRSTLASTRWPARSGDSSKWSMRSPALRGQRLRK